MPAYTTRDGENNVKLEEIAHTQRRDILSSHAFHALRSSFKITRSSLLCKKLINSPKYIIKFDVGYEISAVYIMYQNQFIESQETSRN